MGVLEVVRAGGGGGTGVRSASAALPLAGGEEAGRLIAPVCEGGRGAGGGVGWGAGGGAGAGAGSGSGAAAGLAGDSQALA